VEADYPDAYKVYPDEYRKMVKEYPCQMDTVFWATSRGVDRRFCLEIQPIVVTLLEKFGLLPIEGGDTSIPSTTESPVLGISAPVLNIAVAIVICEPAKPADNTIQRTTSAKSVALGR
jgi:hypothetical protein